MPLSQVAPPECGIAYVVCKWPAHRRHARRQSPLRAGPCLCDEVTPLQPYAHTTYSQAIEAIVASVEVTPL
ncbi:hypothetical protein BHE74_00049301 [Ensete ventricosum]|nr:hypothetical protein BHE74_00049301 [Ensete ventricosum]RZR96074.1 hypothetical protein BHM03_00025014 [Ensete ventricosum]